MFEKLVVQTEQNRSASHRYLFNIDQVKCQKL